MYDEMVEATCSESAKVAMHEHASVIVRKDAVVVENDEWNAEP